MLQKKQNKQSIAIVGGGRWARVYFSVLSKLDLPFEQIVIVSKHNAEKLKTLLDPVEVLNPTKSPSKSKLNVVPTLKSLISDYNVQAAIVVNAAQQHFDTASFLLNQRIPILVEKPLVLTSKEAYTLIEKAEKQGICLVPALQLRFCSYLHNFAKRVFEIEERPIHFLIEWQDCPNEIRYGEAKTFDTSIHVAQDIMPHIWTILYIIFRDPTINFLACKEEQEGNMVYTVRLEHNIVGKIILSRQAKSRKRKISMEYPNHQTLSLDFTQEPGSIFVDQHVFSADPEWTEDSRPLAKQIQYFLSKLGNHGMFEEDITGCLQSTLFTEEASNLSI